MKPATTVWFKILIICLIGLQITHCAITMVKSDGTQSTEAKIKKESKSARPKLKTPNKSSNKQKTPHSQYNMMWVTPFEIFNISTMDDNIIDPSINKIMADYAMNLYNKFIKGVNDGKIVLNGIDPKASMNDKFFHLQQYLNDENRLHKSDLVPREQFNLLKTQIKNVLNIYLTRSGVHRDIKNNALNAINTNSQENNDMFIWATMLANGSYHAPHSHEHSIVSGVYFAKIPTESINGEDNNDVGGCLVLGDPRGTGITPFGLKYIHIPIEGQIVLFPGYLMHWVEPVKSNDWRISFSFNIPGNWEDLSDTSMFYNY